MSLPARKAPSLSSPRRARSWVFAISLAFVAQVLPAVAGHAAADTPTALLVVGETAPLGAGDVAVQTRLEGLGYTVTVVDDVDSGPDWATGKTIVVISATSISASVGTKFTATTVPVVTWEHALFDDLGMTAVDGTQVAAQHDLVITAPGHPLAAGLSGTVTAASTDTEFAQGSPNGNAAIIARLPGAATASIFAYEAGSAMPGLTAPARRVALFMSDLTPASFTADGAALFDAAIDWAVGTAVPPTAHITSLPAWISSNSVALSWSGSTTGAPIKSYDVRYRRAAWNGTFAAPVVWRSATTTTSGAFPAFSGSTYCFSVRSRDAVGTVSAYTSETCTAIPLDDRSFARTGTWYLGSHSAYFRSTFSRSTTLNAKLTRTGVVAKSIALLVTKCATCGTVKVYWGSTLLKSISLYSSTTKVKQFVTVVVFTSARSGTLSIKVTSSRKSVYIDGVAIRRN